MIKKLRIALVLLQIVRYRRNGDVCFEPRIDDPFGRSSDRRFHGRVEAEKFRFRFGLSSR
jgi:hypothetical protein